ncbi:hypothetical protein [Ruegeria hyattellae]|uniref:hypothetical protein n=1 Tax=Ruegeria hyattellae TaxID=3233337 RepID=UPI00355BA420
MNKQHELEKCFGLDSSRIQKLRGQDPILEELLSDYLTLSRDLDTAKNNSDADAEKFLKDARESLRALELEIREKLSCATQIAKP